MTGNVALFRRMLVEGYRLHTKLFGPARFLLFPAFVAVLVGSGVYLLSLTGTSMGTVVAGLHALVVFSGYRSARSDSWAGVRCVTCWAT